MIVANERSIIVGLAELSVTKEPSVVLTCVGLGSCIALCAYDPMFKVGAMAHMLLPTCRSKSDISGSPSKYIDTGVPLLISRMIKQGALRNNLIVKIVGGARMLSIPGENNHLDIGQKNILEVKSTLARENIAICGADVGGGFGRTVQFFVDTGRIIVKAVNGRVIEL
jgi:chemotaxis protein CheD